MEINQMFITEKEVSKITGIALSTLRNRRFHRTGINFYKIGRSCKYRYDDVIAFMEKRKIKTDQI